MNRRLTTDLVLILQRYRVQRIEQPDWDSLVSDLVNYVTERERDLLRRLGEQEDGNE